MIVEKARISFNVEVICKCTCNGQGEQGVNANIRENSIIL